MKNTIINNKADFDSLFNSHYNELCIYAYKFLRNKDLCEDKVQDVFFAIWEKRKKIVISVAPKTYLYTAVRNRCIDYIRKEMKFSFELYEDKLIKEIESVEIPENTQDIVSHIRNAINNLPDKCRTIFCLSKDLKMSHNEIAEEFKISKKTIENQITIAIKKIREQLKSEKVLDIVIINIIINIFKH